MKNNFCNIAVKNIYTKPNIRSEVSTQILYGERFKILSEKKNWLKIKTDFDNYTGFIKKQKFLKHFKPLFKIFKPKSRIFVKKKNKISPSKNFLYFASGISVLNKNKDYIEFEKNKWIKKKDTKVIDHYEKNYSKIFKLFLESKYLWGGKTRDGIDPRLQGGFQVAVAPTDAIRFFIESSVYMKDLNWDRGDAFAFNTFTFGIKFFDQKDAQNSKFEIGSAANIPYYYKYWRQHYGSIAGDLNWYFD